MAQTLGTCPHSSGPVAFRLRCGDPTEPVALGAEATGRLAVGGAAFHGFSGGAGHLFQPELRTAAFAGELRLLDAEGRELASADDGGPGELDRCTTHLVRQAGSFRVQVAARGSGGGGDYRLTVRELPIPELHPAQWHDGRLGSAGVAYWTLAGRKDQRVVLLLRSPTIGPELELQGPDGERLALGGRAGAADDLLLSARLPRDGRCVVSVRARSGDGAYRLRLLDGE